MPGYVFAASYPAYTKIGLIDNTRGVVEIPIKNDKRKQQGQTKQNELINIEHCQKQ